MFKSLVAILIFLPLAFVNAQEQQLLFLKTDTTIPSLRLQEKYFFNSSEKRSDFLNNLIQELHAKNYLEASVDSLSGENTDTLTAWLHIGAKVFVNILIPDLADEVVRRRDRRDPEESLQTVPGALTEIERQLIFLQEHGYPFASMRWDTLFFQNDSMQMSAQLEKGPLVTLDSVINKEDAKISMAFLKSYLGIRKGMPYRESLLDESDVLLKKLPYVKFSRPSAVFFEGEKSSLQVYLSKRKVSRFDFLIGVLPNNASSGKILITGEARIQLMNAFRQGEEIYLEWKRLQQNSQQLKLRFNYPFLLNTPLGISGQFHLDKRDSTFIDILANAGLPIRTRANNYIKAFLDVRQTIVLRTDTNFVKNNKRLPAIQDVSTLMYGFEGYFENLNYLFNPTKGLEMRASFQVGNKKIKPSNSILNLKSDDFSYASLYDSIDTKSLQMLVRWTFNAYLPLSKRNIVKFGIQGQALINDNLLDNELLRIGGNKLLRGFDEEALFVAHYNILTAEYRFILEQNSYMYAFVDAAYTGRTRDGKYQKDFPIGFGAGMAFETKAGIFGISYALGRQTNVPLDFRSSKIHFGYVNIF